MMLRDELKEEIYDLAGVEEHNRLAGRSLGENALKEIYKFINPNKSWYPRRRAYRYRIKIDSELGLDLSRREHKSPFNKGPLKKILEAMESRPEYNSWENVLGWQYQAHTQES